MKSRDFVKDYFHFSKRDRLALGLLLLTLIIILILPSFLPEKNNPPVFLSPSLFTNNKDKSNPPDIPEEISTGALKDHSRPFTGFFFDPNTIGKQEWEKLGLRDRTIQTILRYRSKGAQFKTREDLRKIYGLREEEYRRIENFVRIGGISSSPTHYPSNDFKPGFANQKLPAFKKERPLLIDINQADSIAWVAIPGIGPKLSSRILNFRQKLGGFYSVDQVGQTFGLSDSTFQQIRPLLEIIVMSVRKLNINQASEDELKSHPYLRWQLAKAIVAYRKEHGEFRSLDDLKNIMAFSEETYNKVVPYLEL